MHPAAQSVIKQFPFVTFIREVTSQRGTTLFFQEALSYFMAMDHDSEEYKKSTRLTQQLLMMSEPKKSDKVPSTYGGIYYYPERVFSIKVK